jgi:hypothetical protein
MSDCLPIGRGRQAVADARFPDFYIVGAPKCGTTALYTYLREHPSVFLPIRKEPHFFDSDLVNTRAIRNERQYLGMFANAPPESLRGEASSLYLFSQVAIRDIAAVRPDAKLIVLLRNPAAAAEAFHAHLVSHFAEDIHSFEAAWRAQQDRAAGRRVPINCAEPLQLQYSQLYAYRDQLERAFAAIPTSQIKILIYEEFFSAPERYYGEVQDFLNLRRVARATFDRVNPGRIPTRLRLHRLIAAPPFPVSLTYRPLRYISHKFGLGLGRRAMRLVKTEAGMREAVSLPFRKELDAFVERETSALEELLKRNLDLWRTYGIDAPSVSEWDN